MSYGHFDIRYRIQSTAWNKERQLFWFPISSFLCIENQKLLSIPESTRPAIYFVDFKPSQSVRQRRHDHAYLLLVASCIVIFSSSSSCFVGTTSGDNNDEKRDIYIASRFASPWALRAIAKECRNFEAVGDYIFHQNRSFACQKLPIFSTSHSSLSKWVDRSLQIIWTKPTYWQTEHKSCRIFHA